MKKVSLTILILILVSLLILSIRDNKTESIEINKNLLNNLYYENENDAFFYSSNIYDVVTNQINLYAINWLLKMNEVIDVSFSKEFTAYVEKFCLYDDLNFSIKNKNDLLNFYNMLSVRKNFSGNIENKSYYINLLSNAYTEEQWGYFQSDNYEDKVFKTQILYLVLQNFDILEQIPENIKSNMIFYLKSFLNNTEYFKINNDDLKRNLVDFEIIILQSLILLDKYTDENLLELVKTKEIWIIQQFENLNKELMLTTGTTNMIFLNECILNLNQVLESAEINKSFYKEYADNFNSKLISETYLMDTQITYKVLKVCDIFYKIIDKETKNFINKNANYWIFKETPFTNLKELYYSIKLAHIYDIDYNVDKIIHFINNYENSTKLQDVYYNYLLRKELSVSFLAGETILKTMAENINNFDSLSLEHKFYLIYLCKELGLNSKHLNDIIIKMTVQNLKSQIINTNIESEFYYLSKIADMLNIKLDSNFISEEIEKYKFSEGGYCIEKNGDNPNTISTYRMIMLKNDYEIQLNDEELSGILIFINKVKGTKGGYYYNLPSDLSDLYNYNNNFSFVSFYYGEVLHTTIE